MGVVALPNVYYSPFQAKVTHLVTPLVAMVVELSRRQQELFKLLGRKDREIQELKENRGTLRRSKGGGGGVRGWGQVCNIGCVCVYVCVSTSVCVSVCILIDMS